MKLSPSQTLLACHHLGGKMKCSPTWNVIVFSFTSHWSERSTWPLPTTRAQEVKFYLAVRSRRGRNMMIALTAINAYFKNYVSVISLIVW